MRKRKMALLLAALMLAGCGSGAKASEGPAASQAESLEGSQAAGSAASQAESLAGESGKEGASGEEKPLEDSDAAAGESVSPEPSSEPESKLPDLDPIGLLVGQKYRYDADYGEDYRLYAQIEWGEVRLAPKDKERYPALAEALAARSAEAEELGLELYDGLAPDARERAASDPEAPPYSDTLRFFPRRSDSAVVSILASRDGYTGGAHGYSNFSGINYDPASGEEIQLKDLVKDEAGFISYVSEELDRRYQGYDLEDPAPYMEGLPDDCVPFTIEPNGVTLYFNEYFLGSYAQGSQEIFVPFAGNEKLFDAAYIGEGSWMLEAASWLPTYVDLDDDGTAEAFRAYPEMDGYYGTGLAFFIDEQEISPEGEADEGGFSSMRIVLAHLEDGRDYAYFLGSYDNDYQIISVYSLDGKAPKKVGQFDGGFRHPSDYEQGELRCALLDPAAFELDVHGDVLSTYNAYATFHLGAEGLPETDQPWYSLEWPRVLTLKKDLAAVIVSDTTGEALGEETVPAGSELTLMRTDNASFADLMLDDGRYVRVDIDTSERPFTVKGELPDEYFDGMVFAG